MSFDFTPQQLANFGPEAETVIRALLAEIQRLNDRLAELEARKTPQNSSMPPSTQHPHAWPSPKTRTRTKQGGQHGHKKHQRSLIPTEQCDDVQTLKPVECRRCGTQLSGSDPQPRRHQVWELPEIKPHVTEYQRHRLVCPHCRQTTRAALPLGVPTVGRVHGPAHGLVPPARSCTIIASGCGGSSSTLGSSRRTMRANGRYVTE